MTGRRAIVAVAPDAGTAITEDAPILPDAESLGQVPVQNARTAVLVVGKAAAVPQMTNDGGRSLTGSSGIAVDGGELGGDVVG